ncbi:MAG: Hsp20/alpha crystallin family protein [bacterium]|jgi:HSP20 family protein|nr:Hsp20/alpha crystallin family protein [bacterium]
MDEEAKKFFEELSHAPEEEISLEPEVELVRATSIPLKEKRASKKETQISDLMEEGVGQLTVDVYQTPNEIVVESTIAGVNPDDVDINITNESVTITGKRVKEQKVIDEDYFYQECYWGKFSRSIILPQEVDAENSSAIIKNGVLTIKMPKLNRQKSKKLKVKFE